MSKNQETILSNSIIKAIEKKYNNVWVHKNVVAKAKLGSGFYSSVGLGTGSSDLICCVSGKFVGLEIKVPGKDLEAHQIEWGKMIRSKGGIFECVRCILDAFAVIDGVLAGTYKETPL